MIVHPAYKLNQWLQFSHKEKQDPDGVEANSAAYSRNILQAYATSFKNRTTGSTPQLIL
jgi:hypothetical protein